MNEQIKVICPNCKNRLTIPYQSGLSDKLLTCPICRFKAKVAIYQQGRAAQGGYGSDGEPTQVNFDSLGAMDRTIGSLYIKEKEFALKKGKTVIGRCASTSRADMQIPTDDLYMSRVHAAITVREGANGLVHLLEPMNPKNPIRVNGIKMEQGDVVALEWGDRLQFGHTELIFEHPKYNEESTRIEE